MNNSIVGKQFKFQFSHLMQTVTCTLTVIGVKDGIVRARIPKSVMAMPFPPAGKVNNVLLFPESKVLPILIG